MCLEWVCNHVEADSFNAKMVYQQGVAERNIIKMAAELVCFQAKARLTTLRIGYREKLNVIEVVLTSL